MATPAWDSLRAMWEQTLARLPHVAIGLGALLLFVAAGFVMRRVLLAAASRSRHVHEALALAVGRLAVGVAAVLGLLLAAVIVFPAFKPGDLVAGLGLTSVAIGFAFKDILQNFLAGILILWREPFRIGDQIRSGEFEGTVEDINTRSTRLKTYDGERVVLPNADVYTRPIVVRTAYAHRRVRFVVGIGYGDSIGDARETMMRAVAGAEGVLRDPGPWVYVSELAPSSVNFTVYFWTEPHQANVLRVADRVIERVKEALDRTGVDIPYPHQVVLLQSQPPSAPDPPA